MVVVVPEIVETPHLPWHVLKVLWCRAAERAFCSDSFLSARALEGIHDLRRQFQQLLAEAGFLGSGAGRGRRSGWEAADAHAGMCGVGGAVLWELKGALLVSCATRILFCC